MRVCNAAAGGAIYDRTIERVREGRVEQLLDVQTVPALLELVKKNPKLPQGKALYVKYGCRGDWPDLQPPEWRPTEPSPTAHFVTPEASPIEAAAATASGAGGPGMAAQPVVETGQDASSSSPDERTRRDRSEATPSTPGSGEEAAVPSAGAPAPAHFSSDEVDSAPQQQNAPGEAPSDRLRGAGSAVKGQPGGLLSELWEQGTARAAERGSSPASASTADKADAAQDAAKVQ